MLPHSLGDLRLIYTGIRIASDMIKLSEDYSLEVKVTVDLAN